MSRRFLTLREAARLLGVDVSVLRVARDAGDLPVYQLGERWQRVDREELLAWFRTHRFGKPTTTSNDIQPSPKPST